MYIFLIFTITLVSSSFSLGGAAYLYIRYRTRVLRLVLLFLLSLLLITAGFWTTRLKDILPAGYDPGLDAVSWLFQLTGGGLNIAVLPYFVSALVSIPLKRPLKILLWGWNSLFIILAFVIFLFPGISAVPPLLSLQQVLTILGSPQSTPTASSRNRQKRSQNTLLLRLSYPRAYRLRHDQPTLPYYQGRKNPPPRKG
jgi:hypothetical protein